MKALVQSLGLRVKETREESPDMVYYIRDTFVKHGDLNVSDGLYRLDAAEQHMQPRDLLKYVQLSTFHIDKCISLTQWCLNNQVFRSYFLGFRIQNIAVSNCDATVFLFMFFFGFRLQTLLGRTEMQTRAIME